MKRHQRLKRMSAGLNQRRCMVADTLSGSLQRDDARRFLLVVRQTVLPGNSIKVLQQPYAQGMVMPDVEQEPVELIGGSGRMLVKLKTLVLEGKRFFVVRFHRGRH